MNQPKVGLITFGDERQNEWEKVFKNLTEPRHQQAVDYFKEIPVEVFSFSEVARSRSDIDRQVDQLKSYGVEVLIAHTPCWTAPNLVVHGIQRMGLPTILLSNKNPATHGTVGFLGAAGALDQIGYPFLRLREDFEAGEAIAHKALPYIRAASALAGIRGSVFGLFGGRSLGIDTGTIDSMQWRNLFGVDVEHIDQLEIVRRAELVPPEQVEETVNWLVENVASVAFDETVLTPEKLAFQVRCYLATKDIIQEKDLNFVAIKCMPELSHHYVPQCISAALLPGPYDAQGVKEPVATGCEADGDGALTMEILKRVSGGTPVLFGDLSYVHEGLRILYLPNCGALCTWYAARSDSPAVNLERVKLLPAIRPGGGAITYFTASPGPITLARLYRKKGRYVMAVIPGEAVELPARELESFVAARGVHQLPTAFVKVEADLDELLGTFGSNHISGVAGHFVKEILYLCEMLGIEVKVFEGNNSLSAKGGV
jgi:L-fucose/D-arabinose isomerase